MKVGRLEALKAKPTRPRRYSHTGMSSRRRTGEAGKCGMIWNESVGWFQERTIYATYTNNAAQRVPSAILRHARRRQRRTSVFSTGCSVSGLNRILSAKPANVKNNSPDENFESKAPASARPNSTILPCVGERHIFGSCQTVSTQNSVTAMSVI